MRRYFIALSRVPRHPPVVTNPQNPSYSVRVIGSQVATGRWDVYAEIRYRETQQLVPAGVPITARITDGNGSFWAAGESTLFLNTLADGTTKYHALESQTVQFDPATGLTVEYEAPDGSTGELEITGTGSGTPDYTITDEAGPYAGETNAVITATVKVVDANTASPVNNVQVAIAAGYPQLESTGAASGSATGARTNSSGIATISWTLGPDEGTHKLKVTTPDSGDELELTATVTEAEEEEYTLTVVNGPFSGTFNQLIQVQVKAENANGDPVAGVAISPVSGYPQVTSTGQPSGFAQSGNTNTSGIATIGWTLGSEEGEHTLRVEAPTGDYVETTADVAEPEAGESPHWNHIGVSVTDYGIHHWPAPLRAAAYDWITTKVDHLIQGNRNEYISRNPSIRTHNYWLLWAPGKCGLSGAPQPVCAMENWLAQNGYDVEKAYLHTAGTSIDLANRIEKQVFKPVVDRWLVNPGDPGFREYAKFRFAQAAASGWTSMFIDEFNDSTMDRIVPNVTMEYSSRLDYYDDWTSLLAELKQVLPSGYFEINPADYIFTTGRPRNREWAIAAGGAMAEFCNNPYAQGAAPTSKWNFTDQLMAGGCLLDQPAIRTIDGKGATSVNSIVNISPSNYASTFDRNMFAEYAYHLMAVPQNNPRQLLFSPWRIISDTHDLARIQSVWLPAFEVDIGHPVANRQSVGSGIWQREFENALVLFRIAPTAPQGQTVDAGVPVTYSLPAGTWKMLQRDGTVGPEISSVDICYAEGIVLMKG